mmetsp:Transcript_5885/g.21514  ORF Transcript_5885/g.21514 Transcript_5885/m.21514 type:complete len:303 (-) Transcript_5885:198-1106(-)
MVCTGQCLGARRVVPWPPAAPLASGAQTLRARVLCLVALSTSLASSIRPLRFRTRSTYLRARFLELSDCSPNSSRSSSVTGTKYGSTSSLLPCSGSQCENTSWGAAAPDVLMRISSAMPKLSATGIWASTTKVAEPSRMSSFKMRALRLPRTAYTPPRASAEALTSHRYIASTSRAPAASTAALRASFTVAVTCPEKGPYWSSARGGSPFVLASSPASMCAACSTTCTCTSNPRPHSCSSQSGPDEVAIWKPLWTPLAMISTSTASSRSALSWAPGPWLCSLAPAGRRPNALAASRAPTETH